MSVTLVEKYNPEWPDWFKVIKTSLGKKVVETCLRIEHVGSTSVSGMTAKPIIDLILVIEPQRFEEIKGILAERGYHHNGDQGIKDREVFKLEDAGVKNSLPTHHLYVCPKNSNELMKETAFRDFLRQRQEYSERLSALKWSLAEKFDNDREPYMEGKAALCQEITEKALEHSKGINIAYKSRGA
ncbi:MAG: GrpB family protein [Dehalococcoidales bacterium]